MGFDDPPPQVNPIQDPAPDEGLVAESPAMRSLVSLAFRIARVETTVLITGESGTGKERIAGLIHRASQRSGGPFLAVNCGAIPETLLESELFGHARGAFTGALTDRTGIFEAANGGSLLLDEISEVPPAQQVKLLRVLQEREVRRVGECRSRPIDVRVLAATNADLAREVREGRFRTDLFYRLDVVELKVPALRERREDILPLARRLLADAARRQGSPAALLGTALEQELLRHPWPGNVRELENAMERAAALAEGSLVGSLPLTSRREAPALPPGRVRTLAEWERDYILAVLEANEGNQTLTALQLGIGTATLYRKLKAYGRVRPRPAPIRNQAPPHSLSG